MRLIDADKLIELFTSYISEDKKVVYQPRPLKIDDIKNAPTIDAVPVVRCKDCKYYNKLLPTSSDTKCDLLYGMTDLLGYCSLGERKG